jgi:branched-chain amino acid transport system substrate-binding protein
MNVLAFASPVNEGLAMTAIPWGVGIVAVALVAGGLSACSKSSSHSASSSSASSSTAALSGDPVEITIPYTGTGPVSYPENTVAIKAAEKAVNDSGGINGRPLKVMPCDAQSPLDANPVTTCMRDRVADKNIVASVGDWTSFNDITTPIENAAHLTQIGGVPLGTSQRQLPNSYPLVMLESQAFGADLIAEGAKKPGLAYIDIASTQSTFSDMNTYLTAAGSNVQFVGKAPVPPTATDIAPQVDKLCDSDGVALALSSTQIAQYLTAHAVSRCASQPMVTTALGIAQGVSTLGAKGNGLLVSSSLPFPSDTSLQGIKMFIDQMNAIDPTARKNEASEITWLAVWAFALEARKMKGDVTRDTVWTHWQQVSTIKVFDLLPPDLNLKSVKTVTGFPRITNQWIRLGVVRDGSINDTGKGWIDVLNQHS